MAKIKAQNETKDLKSEKVDETISENEIENGVDESKEESTPQVQKDSVNGTFRFNKFKK